MHVLHAHWSPPTSVEAQAGVFFWAESSEFTGSKSRQGKDAHPHPFCAKANTVFQLLEEFTALPPAHPAKRLALLLPSNPAGPQPSPQLLYEWEVDNGSAQSLQAWGITSARLPPLEAFLGLARLPAPADLPAGLALGSDIR